MHLPGLKTSVTAAPMKISHICRYKLRLLTTNAYADLSAHLVERVVVLGDVVPDHHVEEVPADVVVRGQGLVLIWKFG